MTSKLISEGFKVDTVKFDLYDRRALHQVSLLRLLISKYRRLDPDFIFHYTIKPNIFGTYAAKALGIPSIAIVTGLGTFPDVQGRVSKHLLYSAYGLSARLSQNVWFLNSSDKDHFQDRGWLKKTGSLILPGEGVNTSHYAFKKPKDVTNRKPFTVLYAGRFICQKGARTFAEAARIVRARQPNIRFRVLGFLELHNPDAIPQAEFRQWTQEGLFAYLGQTHDVRPEIQRADVVVLPTAYREGLSRILLEAMSIGRPIITTNVVGAGELVEHEKNGFLVPVNDSGAVADAIERCSALSAEERAAYGKRSRQIVEDRYDEKYIIESYMEYLEVFFKKQ